MIETMAKGTVTFTALSGIPLIEPGDDLASVLLAAIHRAGIEPRDRDVLVVAQKVVSKAEGRYVDLATVTPSIRAKQLAEEIGKDPRIVEVILSESNAIVRSRKGLLIVLHRLGFIMANAGIDQSNIPSGDGRECVLLLPRDPDASAADLKSRLDREFGVGLGIVINDSFGRPWRNGVTGVAIGAAGLPVLASMVGQPDLFGRMLKVTDIAMADEIAAAASLLMGQAAEGRPAVYIRGLDWDAPPSPARALIRPESEDLFR